MPQSFVASSSTSCESIAAVKQEPTISAERSIEVKPVESFASQPFSSQHVKQSLLEGRTSGMDRGVCRTGWPVKDGEAFAVARI